MTDSNSGIMPAAGKEAGIHVIPMPILIDEQTYYEGQDITPEEFYERLSQGVSATTSQPSPGIIIEAWRALLKSHDEVLYIPMSSGLSNTCQTAVMLAQDNEFIGKVHVVDNHRISVPQAQSVYDAKILAETIDNGSQIKEILEKKPGCQHLYCGRHSGIFKERRTYHSCRRCCRYRPELKAGPHHPGRQAGCLYQNPWNEGCLQSHVQGC